MVEKFENVLNFRSQLFKRLFQVPNLKIFLEVTKYPTPLGIIKVSPPCLDKLEKNCFVKIISHFSKKKNSMEIEIPTKSSFLLKYSIDSRKIIHQNQVTISIKARFLTKFIFHQNFLFEKKEKILTNQFFPAYLNKLGTF